MKHQDSITDVISKNINYALDAIPRALGSEKPKRHRKVASRKLKAKKTGRTVAKAKRKIKALKAKGTGAVKKGAKKVKGAVRKIATNKSKRSSNVHKLPNRKQHPNPSARAA